jgi:hypothetical protein
MFTIVSGIAESLNRRISLGNELPFSELGTKKLTRRRNQGMILMTTNAEEGKLVFCKS